MSQEDWLDRGAFVASTACLVHCLLLPALLAALPALGATLHVPEAFHRWLLAFIVPTSGLALWLAWSRRRVVAVGLLGAIGIALVGLGVFLTGALETAVTVVGSLTLVTAHVVNWKSRRGHCG